MIQPNRLQSKTSKKDYEISELLGRGHYSEVFNATEIATGRPVALKVIAIFEMMDTGQRLDFLREISLLQKIQVGPRWC